MPAATLTSKGQITIPKSIREDLGLKTGDLVDFRKAPDGSVRMEVRATHIRDLGGLLYRKGRHAVAVKKMDAAIARFHSKKP